MFNLDKQKNLVEKFEIFDCKFVAPKTDDKHTALSCIMLYNSHMAKVKNNIIEQIYLLNKLYDKAISKQKQEFDECVANFVNAFETQSQNKVIRALLNQKYQCVLKETNKFARLEKIAKINIENFKSNQILFADFLSKADFSFTKNNYNALIETKFNQNLPCVNFCKEDINKKVNYINSLYDQTTTYEIKGDRTNGI